MRSVSSFATSYLLLISVCVKDALTGNIFIDAMERQCGGTIYLSTIHSKSLKLLLTSEMKYSALLDCHVTVAVEEHMRIHLAFLEMNILSFGACVGDYLMILDSEPLTEDVFHFQDSSIRRYCGSDIPESIVSTTNNLTIRFGDIDDVSSFYIQSISVSPTQPPAEADGATYVSNFVSRLLQYPNHSQLFLNPHHLMGLPCQNSGHSPT
ncbi:tumor necrosis factor-inducible gene 6 protein [Plakobranchus ocellatus]|uniref:Tumor necrosis factor-inducible gene 6 protein n=1 Tax=Plakobranchus ocellatus TaxID=259542 RepID=A0AAV3ZRM1_9GAST|nr:tumor necrosis factor-inducible gene 6 protein [Plakobranchus ocellatus]